MAHFMIADEQWLKPPPVRFRRTSLSGSLFSHANNDNLLGPPLVKARGCLYDAIKEDWEGYTQITINVSGRKFLIYKEFLQQYPTTLLGSSDLEKYYDKEYDDYFFDKNRDAFESIFDFYLYGKLYPPKYVPDQIYNETVEFFGIMHVFKGIEQEENLSPILVKSSPTSTLQEYRKLVAKSLDDPTSSRYGLFWGWLDLFFIILSIVCMTVETLPLVKEKIEVESSWEQITAFTVETITVIFFTIDVLTRFLVVKDRIEFLKSPATILDIITIIPYYVELVVDISNIKSLRFMRMARVIRVLKLAKKNKRLGMIIQVMADSASELGLLVVVWGMSITVAGNIFYYIEYGKNPEIHSCEDSLWWAVVTMSTVGYGDIVPYTPLGKAFSTVFVYVSMIFLALPLTIIVSAFSRQYDSKKCLSVNSNSKREETVYEVSSPTG